jgi:hypothetical protein
MPRVWGDHDQEWELLQVYELWEYKRVQLVFWVPIAGIREVTAG